jgi:quinoprotein glucose dehydrogenase
MGLVATATPDELGQMTGDSSRSVRIGALLALRRNCSPMVAEFLKDHDPAVVLEAARAINDVPIPVAMPALAALYDRPELAEPLARRVINANYRLGQPENARALAAMVTSSQLDSSLRIEALEALRDWATPSGRDLVMGLWRPLPERSPQPAADALSPAIADILLHGTRRLNTPAIEAVGALQLTAAAPALLEVLRDTDRPSFVRAEAVRSLGMLRTPMQEEAARFAVKDRTSTVRTQGHKLLARLHPAEAVQALADVLQSGSVDEKQGAVTTLAEIDDPAVDPVLEHWLARLQKKEVPPEIELELLLAARESSSPRIQEILEAHEAERATADVVARNRELLVGGNSEEGKKVFFERTEASCLRCHLVRGRGGQVGPDLSKIGEQQKREYILESLLAPDKQIAKGFDTVVLTTLDGDIVTGVLKEENDNVLKLMTPEGKLIEINKSAIDERTRGKSAMPDDVTKHLSKIDLRNLVEYLASLK